MNRWIGLLCLATTVALSLACSSGGDLSDSSSKPSTDTFGNPIPTKLKTSFVEINGGELIIGGIASTSVYAASDGTNSIAFDPTAYSMRNIFDDTSSDTDALEETNDTLGNETSISSFQIMDSEVTVSMFVTFLNAISLYSEQLTNEGDGEASTFLEATDIYKTDLMKDDIILLESGIFEVIGDRGDYPITNITQIEAKEFCRWLGSQYRLPTWQEWQFSAKGGSGSEYQFSTKSGNLFNSDGQLTPHIQYSSESITSEKVKSSENNKNPLGLYDMTGNVYEWTYFAAEDSTTATVPYGTRKFVLGGSYTTTNPLYATSWFKIDLQEEDSYASDLGFRVVFDNNNGVAIGQSELEVQNN